MKFELKVNDKFNAMAEMMDWRSLLDQICCPCFTVDHPPQKEYGAVFFSEAPGEKLKRCIAEFRKACHIRPLITSDLESGPGDMITDGTKFPAMLACGQCDDEHLAWQMGKATAIEGRFIGFDWSLAPCVDILRERRSPILNIYSAGTSVDRVVKITKAYLKGMQENGMMGTLKHFPGGGFSLLDPHVTTAVNPLSKQEWDQTSGKAFKELIDAGAMAVMSGHISFPAYDERDDHLQMFPPATVSKRLLSGLLRREFGFEGMIVSDAITMGGVVNYMNYYDACASFFECGGDCLLFPQMDELFYQEMERRLDRGMLSIKTLQNRAARILAMKDQFARVQQSCPLEVPDYAGHRQCSKTISENAVEIVRDRQKFLPIPWNREKKILHLVLSNSFEENKTLLHNFTETLRSTGSIVDEKVDPGPGWLFETMKVPGYDLAVCSLGNPPTWGTNEIHLYGHLTRNMMNGWMRLKVPVVFVNHFDPFTYVEFDAAMDTVINTYGSTEFSLHAVMNKIFALNS